MNWLRMSALFGALGWAIIGAQAAIAQSLDDAESFDLVLSGAVTEQCALGAISDIDFGNLERRGLAAQSDVAFYCNVPFTMRVQGAHGALTHTTMPAGQGPYTGAVEYSMGISMPLRNPSRRVVDRTFSSRALQAGGVVSSNGAIATEGMRLSIALSPHAGPAGLLAGDYSETITITVSPL
ncbi:MAG: hypothetical protein AAFQ90_13185 [Pseudomonadota bacterium]